MHLGLLVASEQHEAEGRLREREAEAAEERDGLADVDAVLEERERLLYLLLREQRVAAEMLGRYQADGVVAALFLELLEHRGGHQQIFVGLVVLREQDARYPHEAQRRPLPFAHAGLFRVVPELLRAEGEVLRVVALYSEVAHLHAGLDHRLRLAYRERLAHRGAQHVLRVVIATAPPEIAALQDIEVAFEPQQLRAAALGAE